MKRISYAGGAVITGDAVAAAVLDYATQLDPSAGSVTVDIPVRELDGSTSIHTLLMGPTSQLEVSNVEGLAPGEEARLFPVPDFPSSNVVAVVEPSAAAEGEAEDFNRAVADIEAGLGQDPAS